VTYVTQAGSFCDKKERLWHHTFSQTVLSGLQMCPESTRAKYFKEVESEDTDSTARGTAVHAGIEYALHEKLAGSPIDLQSMVEVARHELDVIGDWRYTRISRANVYATVEPMLAGWLEQIEPEVVPMFIEHSFNVPLYEDRWREIRLTGMIDCVDQGYVVWDWKTASRPYEPWEKQRWSIQATTYCEAIDQRFDGMAPGAFAFGIMFDDGSTQRIDVTRNQGHVDWLIQQALVLAKLIETNPKGPWVLNDGGWWCSPTWCPTFAAGRCKGAHIHDEKWAKR
jgi:PD-(D/E)XK nuclease superfamily